MVRALVDFVFKKCKIRVIKNVAKELDTQPQIIIFLFFYSWNSMLLKFDSSDYISIRTP